MIQNRLFTLRTEDSTAATTGPVVYWMDRDMRIRDNWTLLHAQEIAIEKGVPLLLVYNLVVNFLGGGTRQLAFKIEALKELERDCAGKAIPFFVLLDTTGNDTPKLIHDFCIKHAAEVLVTDFSPLRIQREWKDAIAKTIPCAMIEVDAHNIVPVRVVSAKQEFAAYTIRPKLHKLLPQYLDTFPTLRTHPHKYQKPEDTESVIDWAELDALLHTSKGSVALPAITWIKPGEKAAHEAMHNFITNRLARYASDRNDPLANAQSNLSPYLHYGMISAQRVALEVMKCTNESIDTLLSASKNKAKIEVGIQPTLLDSAGAFLEELIVRRELADNYCFYNPVYDSTDGFPDWAKKSFQVHRHDSREFVYDIETFETARTHDDLWNAAQQEMRTTGKMHGYMRMYWAKKILEWTSSPEDALRIAIYLNDTYELDGRDSNGYAGIAWSIGGVHDRAWFTRPIFGQVRYMARSGCEKKFNVKDYIQKYSR